MSHFGYSYEFPTTADSKKFRQKLVELNGKIGSKEFKFSPLASSDVIEGDIEKINLEVEINGNDLKNNPRQRSPLIKDAVQRLDKLAEECGWENSKKLVGSAR